MCVAICTRDRGDSIVETLDSVLVAGAAVPFPIEVLVVDQSAGVDTREAVGPFVAKGEVRYLPTSTVGLSRARNVALAATDAEVVLFTDDDCIVAVEWIVTNLAELAGDPAVAIVFGDVVAAPAPPGSIVPVSVAPAPFDVPSLRSWRAVDGVGVGIGASMAVVRAVAVELGGFDPSLGAGGRFRSAEDTDFAVRALLGGHGVRRSTTVRVLHAGHRTSDEFRALTRHAMFGVGCVLAKSIRHAPAEGALLAVRVAMASVVRPGIDDVIHRRRPRVIGRAVFLVRGMVHGARIPVDRSTWCFAEAAGTGP